MGPGGRSGGAGGEPAGYRARAAHRNAERQDLPFFSVPPMLSVGIFSAPSVPSDSLAPRARIHTMTARIRLEGCGARRSQIGNVHQAELLQCDGRSAP